MHSQRSSEQQKKTIWKIEFKRKILCKQFLFLIFCWCLAQFYIQLVYKPQFGTWILLFGSFAQEKKWIWVFLSNFSGCFFSTFCGQKENLKFFQKHWSVCTKKLHKIKLKKFFFDTWKKNYEFLIGYHSNFDFECNTEQRGSIESLSIALQCTGNRYKGKAKRPTVKGNKRI